MAVVISDGGENMKHVSLLGEKRSSEKKDKVVREERGSAGAWITC